MRSPSNEGTWCDDYEPTKNSCERTLHHEAGLRVPHDVSVVGFVAWDQPPIITSMATSMTEPKHLKFSAFFGNRKAR